MILRIHAPGSVHKTHRLTACGRLYQLGDRVLVEGESTEEETTCKICINKLSSDGSLKELIGRRSMSRSRPKLKLIKGGLHDGGNKEMSG